MRKRKKLTEEQIQELKFLINDKKSSKKEVMRCQAVLLINESGSTDLINTLVGFNEKYAYKLRQKYLKMGVSVLLDKCKKAPKELLTRGQRVEIMRILKTLTPRDFGINEDFWSTSILGKLIKEQYNVEYKSKTSYYLLFKQAKFSFHKPAGRYKKHDQKAIDKWEKEMNPIITSAYKDEKVEIIVADEMILTSQTTFQKIWLPEGAYPKIDIANIRKRRGIYGFLDSKTGNQYAFKTEKINSEETIKILNKIGKIYKKKKILLLWDGAPWHRSDIIKKFLNTTKHSFQLFRFPPYAPDLNPQEHVWKAGRSKITHNEHIGNIDKITHQFVNYLNQTKFNYKFF